MDSLRTYYQPPVVQHLQRQPPPRVSRTHEFFNPVVSHRWGGHFPLLDPEKKVVLDIEEYPRMIFQRPPSFAYYPEHSNLDVYFSE